MVLCSVGPLIAVAIGDGEDADDKYEVEDELEEDAVSQLFVLATLSGLLQVTPRYRFGWLGFTV